MKTSDIIRELYDRMDSILVELCRQIGQARGILIRSCIAASVSSEEMAKIAEVLDVGYKQAFVLPNGEKIGF